jgi:serine/threonine protein kinase
MGTVYLARNESLGSRVAVKFLAPHLLNQPALAERFRREGKASVDVAHANAIQLLDAGTEGSQLYLVFEYAEGEDLRTVLDRERTLPLSDAVQIAVKVAEVLSAAHAKGIVHRDIKPENLRVRRDLSGYQVKVLDFGVARVLDTPRLTQEGGATGTPTYMAPEVVEAKDFDGRCDLYALGLVFYEMLAGRQAFEGSLTQLFFKQMHEPTPSLGVPAIDQVIARATAKSPGERYPDVASFARALQGLDPTLAAAVTEELGPTSIAMATPAAALSAPSRTPNPEVPVAPPPARRTDAPVLLLTGALLLLLGGGAVFVVTRRADPPPVVVATPPPPVAPACPGLDMYDSALTSLSLTELEERVLNTRIMAPSMSTRQLESMRTSLENYPADKRPCMWRMMLVGSLVSERTLVRTEPSMWGQQHDEKELRALFLKTPLTKPWSVAQREAVLEKIETIFLPSLKKDDPRDEAYWRRMYYGIELLCEVTDPALMELKGRRPQSCLNLTP